MRKRTGMIVAGMWAMLAGRALATWSIVIVDTRTGEIAVASATCLTNFDLQANTPVVLVGVGGATAQSAVDQFGLNRTYIRDQFYLGTAPSAILAGLAARDGSHQSRQYGMVDALGRALTFSGTGDGPWAGGATGQTGDLVYAVQGNVLTGQPVVNQAVLAIINTPGDLPAKLMAAMEAARAMGGDGRCSCSPSAPDSCGSPPPDFEKSAHIAYMIIARPGDEDGSNGNYKTPANTPSIAIADFDNDGKSDIAACGNSVTVSIMKNVTIPGAAAMFSTASTTPAGPTLRDIAAIDMTGDGNIDVVGTDQTNGRVIVMRGLGDGTISPIGIFPCGTTPTAVAAADLNGDQKPDVATANSGTSTVGVLFNTGTGAVGAPTQYPAGAGANLVEAADMDHDGDIDLVVGTATAKTVEVLLNNGSGIFSTGPVVTFAGAPYALAIADLNHDGLNDIAVSVAGDASVRVLLNSGSGFSNTGFLASGTSGGGIVVRDFNNDAIPDIAVLNRSQRLLAVLDGIGDGTFLAARTYPVGFTCTTLASADLNGDGWADVATSMTSGASVITMNQAGNGEFNTISGLAGGEYFMDFNVANRQAADPDPVFTLRDEFDAWRASLIGIPDAGISTATFDTPRVRADGHSVATLTITARDWAGSLVPVKPSEVTLAHDSVLTAVGAPLENGDGTVSVPVVAHSSCGADSFRVTLSGPPRDVVIMPRSTLELVSPADFNLDGFVNGADFDLFVGVFESGDTQADFDGDGFVTGKDFDRFVNEFESPC